MPRQEARRPAGGLNVKAIAHTIAVISFLALGGAAKSAEAQTARGFAVNRFEPSERGSDWFALESLDLRGTGRVALGVVGEWAYRPLALYRSDGVHEYSVVRNQFFLHPGASYTLWDRLRLGLDLPVQAYADGNGGVIDGVTYPKPASATALGDVRLGADVRLFGNYGDTLSGAVGAQVFLPVGQRDSYAGDGGFRLAPRALLAGEIGELSYAGKLGLQYRSRSELIDGSPIGSELSFAAALGVRLLERRLLIGPELCGSSVLDGGGAFTRRATPVEGLLGGHYALTQEWRLGAGVGSGLSRGYGSPAWRGVLSLEWAARVAPPRPLDSDSDGIIDAEDACPQAAGVPSRDHATNGCPRVPDRDRDGVADQEDVCPDVAGARSQDRATNGCPPVEPEARYADKDNDMIQDIDDACPDDAGVATGDARTHGCPDVDRDRDAIANVQDACPDVAGEPSDDPARHGCPKAFVEGESIKILSQIKFEKSSAKIAADRETSEVLTAVLQVLRAHPEIRRLQVVGHTDNRGVPRRNKKLSAERASAVVAWLVRQGVEGSRLHSAGLGSEQPLASNDTAQGRQSNRRVEFRIEHNAGPRAQEPAAP
jgi:OmpA-OmpF porin, OOP family